MGRWYTCFIMPGTFRAHQGPMLERLARNLACSISTFQFVIILLHAQLAVNMILLEKKKALSLCCDRVMAICSSTKPIKPNLTKPKIYTYFRIPILKNNKEFLL